MGYTPITDFSKIWGTPRVDVVYASHPLKALKCENNSIFLYLFGTAKGGMETAFSGRVSLM